MRITHTTAAERAVRATRRRSGSPSLELAALLVASLVSLAGVWLVFSAKAADANASTAGTPLLDINTIDRAEQLLPVLDGVVADPVERRFVADRITAWLTTPDGSGDLRRRVPSVGALGAITVSDADVKANRRLVTFRQRLGGRRAQLDAAGQIRLKPDSTTVTVPLLTPSQLGALRPSLVVRAWRTFRTDLILASALFVAAFYVAWISARARRLSSDPLLLPAVHLLCGIGFAMMISLRDPLRDAALFPRFSQGVVVGLIGLMLVRLVDLQRSQLRRLSYVPLLGAIGLSVLLIIFGSGPGTSDAKVNLLGVQPVEAIRVLVVLFLAGYFANRWELLRSLKEPRLGGAARFGFDVPRLDFVLPVLVGMALILVFFFLQKDLGPALVLACVFLAMYGVARRRLTMVGVGLGLLVSGFLAGYLLGFPHTVVQRVQMWMSPWDNVVRGGDQVAHALWALAAGAVSGTGLGLGDPRLIPAGHTDLILAVVGEELGFAGIAAVVVLFGLVAWRCLRIALRAPGDYTFFLALGLTLGLVLQLALIAAGLLGLMPLTGVATPFLSYGRSSMIANLFAIGMILAIGARAQDAAPKPEFERPALALAGAVAVLLLAALGRAAMVQVVSPNRTLIAPALTVQADGERRFEYNPRLLAVAQLIERGTIFDRNGIPLATSRPADLAGHAEDLTKLGVTPAPACGTGGARCYPFGGLTYHLLGDFRTQANWAASNTSFVERDSDARLRGYDDHARVVEVPDARTGAKTRVLRRDLTELIPLLRKRYNPDDESVKRLLARPRDVRLSIDVRMQLKLGEIVKSGVDQAGRKEGAAVVLSGDGDLLAAVSYPWPAAEGSQPTSRNASPEEREAALLDRARYGDVSTRLQLQAGHGQRRAPQEPGAPAPAVHVRTAAGRARRAEDPGVGPADSRRSGRQDAAWHDRPGTRPRCLLQRLLRPTGPAHWRAGPAGDSRSLRNSARAAGQPARGSRPAALRRVRPGPGPRIAVEDGASRRHDRRRGGDAAGTLGRRRDEPAGGPAAADPVGSRRADAGARDARGGARGHGPQPERASSRRLPARRVPPKCRMRRRIRGSWASRRTGRPGSASRLPSSWSTAATARASRPRSPVASSRPRASWALVQ